MDSVKTRPTVMIVDMGAAFRSQCAQALKKQNIEVVAEADNGMTPIFCLCAPSRR